MGRRAAAVLGRGTDGNSGSGICRLGAAPRCGRRRRFVTTVVARGESIKWIVVVGELLVVMREGRQPVVRIEGVARGGNCESGHLFVDLNHGGGRSGSG